MLAFCDHTWWRKPENSGKTTDLRRATTTLPHDDTGIRSWIATLASECFNHCAIQAPLIHCINTPTSLNLADGHSDKNHNHMSWLNIKYHLSPVMRKPTFCICKNKGADQLRGNLKADQRLCFSLHSKYDPSTF